MIKLAANLSLLFNEVPLLDRFGAAAAAGFRAVEIQFPYAHAPDQIAARLKAHDLQLVLHNLPAGRWDSGERGIACHPARVAEFREGIALAIGYAAALDVRQLNCLAGIVPQGVTFEQAHATFVSNLKVAAAQLKAAGIRLLIEPINTFDMPGFFLNRTRQAVDIIAETGSDNLFLQYDVYHMQRMEGELFNTIRAQLPRIAHIQLADNPGRCEPGTGEINFRNLFRLLDELGYGGWTGCEYTPQAGTIEGLGWRAAHGV